MRIQPNIQPEHWLSQRDFGGVSTRVFGVTSFQYEYGFKHPIVVLHGLGESLYTYRNVGTNYLLSLGEFVVPDLPGFGGTEPLPQVNLSSLRTWVDAVIDVFPERSVILVSAGFGSLLAFDYAHRNPTRVEGIVHWDSITSQHAMHLEAQRLTNALDSGSVGKTAMSLSVSEVERPLCREEITSTTSPLSTQGARATLATIAEHMQHGQEWSDTVDDYNSWFQNQTQVRLLQLGRRSSDIAKQSTDLEHLHGRHLAEDDPHAVGFAIDSWMQKSLMLPTRGPLLEHGAALLNRFASQWKRRLMRR